jgi:hypothetical protein
VGVVRPPAYMPKSDEGANAKNGGSKNLNWF